MHLTSFNDYYPCGLCDLSIRPPPWMPKIRSGSGLSKAEEAADPSKMAATL